MLRRIDHGDDDLIITLFTREKGKISVIAKSAKKSVKRFSGVLDLFSVLQTVCTSGRGKGLLVLQEASLEQLFPKIRENIIKTAYASYWIELINQWLEEGQAQPQLYHLIRCMLEALDCDSMPEESLSILFQMRFLSLAGLSPNLDHCSACKTATDKIQEKGITFDIRKGGLVCGGCGTNAPSTIHLSKGTIKQLQWSNRNDLKKAMRLKITSVAIKEGLSFLEAFVPYHLGREPKSLGFLRKIRH